MLVAAGNGDCIATKRLGEPQGVGDPVAFHLVELSRSAPFDKQRRERGVQPVRQALGVAHETGRARVFADADKDALACRPRAWDRAGLHLGQKLFVDPLGGAAKRKLAQSGQVSRREEMLQRALGLLGNVNLSFLQALDEVVRA